MADNVHLNIYLTKSEATALDKTLEEKIELTGTLRDASNVLNPSIEIQASATTIANRNYFEIPEFGRKYFITEITSTGYGRVIISGHVDVLSTYKNDIRKLKAVIARQENRYNLYIDDNLFKVDSRTIIQTKDFSGGGTFASNPGICLVLVG
jgi:hypothetical protein